MYKRLQTDGRRTKSDLNSSLKRVSSGELKMHKISTFIENIDCGSILNNMILRTTIAFEIHFYQKHLINSRISFD